MLSEQKPALAEKVNVQGTQLVIDAISAQSKPPVLVFPSSISVHGFSNTRQPPCTTDLPFDARDHYAGHKIECEKRLRASTIPWVILRIGACTDATNQKSDDMESMLRHMFTLDVKTRIEYLHPKDAAIAIANAVATPAAIGKTLFLGSGAASQTHWLEFVNLMPRAMGIGELPADAFGHEPYYTDWMDTTESQALLQFQQYGLDAYKQELQDHWRWRRYLVWPVSGLIRRYMLKFSQLAR
jgi:nucleoside-diphosphate-sugar epimerase